MPILLNWKLKKDDVTVLKEWNNLEHLNISGNGLTEEIQQYLCDILSCCTIEYNEKLLSNHNWSYTLTE